MIIGLLCKKSIIIETGYFMNFNTKDTVIGAVAIVIGAAVGKGIVDYATHQDFKKWEDKNLYPTIKK